MSKVILISQIPLPYDKIGSWSTLYKNYLQNNHKIDYIVCVEPELKFENVQYSFVKNDFVEKIIKRITKNPYAGYLKALEKIIKPEEKYIIQIVDNFGIVKRLIHFLEQNNKRSQFYIQFFYHGFPPFYENFYGNWFFENIDEMVLLTHDSYKVHKQTYTVLPTKFSVLHNGIDTSKFHKISSEDKAGLKKELGITNKKIFVWCSQDRPKKGLNFILDAWKRINRKDKDAVLLVIGANREFKIEGVTFLGRIPNNELPKYYQIADCYLFPTLWHEGFGLSLIEALHCGCYCIASANGGVPEVLQYGKLGKLIEKPNFVEEWVTEIEAFLNQDETYNLLIPDNLYSMKNWNEGMNEIIENAKKNLS
ncbi:glycosyltransferase family 4 protein [Flavobacterium johnsoniae]|jgi:glycosyltransferase involved in cell wall biosynthesis|uniref:Candidate alpha-glycosyltransferase Glycosyltransferase family 4 n=1 Tax=Flavobacterium johnsoniae (strain ATCC 17061 / DSM 2064 / JCM 8514 / BCRC 14874 / CCUG 350202 / NBRC 14942 / NCIMB 11054 / UW101) TaxID=376686 RepID=A5FN77_FLAJ1|nr:glycosyltransferase family 4 protein [Flavobacterium johnsoniae]ABQ03344.1 Candidate alpha-glycosyltransferase; Glycosyltransferase family 4 [Flavobacterium johnsoniae UW101]OXG01239.1 glycosyl transferase family 1 [Flavobacterium johnsoniae UW101]WQG79791.1 glycosyltransferase family 4 protein [Flavobacterium johnsoniae UW101]SHL77964.1 Glycosyltransferase involved in cell wall bisynthesis [Flavobacterium johnsoniae]